MNYHIAAQPGDIAETVIISGDPLRIKHMANKFLDDAKCFNEIRGMYGYTGNWQGKRVSMMGTGIGIPTTALYVHELINNHGVKRIIRAGTLGAFTPDLEIGEVVIAMSASTDSAVFNNTFNNMNYAPTASYHLLEKAAGICKEKQIAHKVGQIFSTDSFYNDAPNRWDAWIEHGVLGVEMETSVIYTLAAKYNVEALSICTVSVNLITGAASKPETREKQFDDMFKIVLEIAWGNNQKSIAS